MPSREFKNSLDWEEKARQNPLFAVMSDAEFATATNKFTPLELANFYHQGERFWNRWFQQLLWDNASENPLSVLEYGCGMGRLLNAAASRNVLATGVDISATQIGLAREHCPNRDKIRFMTLDSKSSIPLECNVFDIVYSYAVFQHIRRKSQLHNAIQEICRVLKPNGVVKVQCRALGGLSFADRYAGYLAFNMESFSVLAYLRRIGPALLPIVKLNRHTHWTGAGCFHSIRSLIHIFRRHGVKIALIEQDTQNNIAWLTGTKHARN